MSDKAKVILATVAIILALIFIPKDKDDFLATWGFIFFVSLPTAIYFIKDHNEHERDKRYRADDILRELQNQLLSHAHEGHIRVTKDFLYEASKQVGSARGYLTGSSVLR